MRTRYGCSGILSSRVSRNVPGAHTSCLSETVVLFTLAYLERAIILSLAYFDSLKIRRIDERTFLEDCCSINNL